MCSLLLNVSCKGSGDSGPTGTTSGLGGGTIYYVSPNGNDANPGTEEAPWRTVQKAADTLRSGETVYIRAGTYYERVVPQNSGNDYITYASYPGETAILDGTGVSFPSDWGGLFEIANLSNIRVSGLKVMNVGPGDNHAGILVDNSTDIIIEHNHTSNTTSSGIGVWDSRNVIIDGNEVELCCNDGEQECITVAITDTFEIRNNHIHHGGPGSIGGEGIDAKDGSSHGKIYGNHVHHMNRVGIYVEAWDKHTYDIDVYRNIVHDIADNDGFALASEEGGVLEDVRVYNNIAYNNGLSGIVLSEAGNSPTHPVRNITIINNTFANNGSNVWGGGISIENPDVSNLVIRNNICSQNRWFQIQNEVAVQQLTIDHNLIHGTKGDAENDGADAREGDPLFVNAGGGNFRLRSGSPAIDAGSADNAPFDDFDGVGRPQGAGYDIGAFEQ
jgi:parallel beta-helix repeat protein